MVTIEKILRISNDIWQVQYSSSLEDPTFYIYIDGIQVAVTELTCFSVPVAVGEEAVIEILDDPDEEPLEVYPGRAILGWPFVDEGGQYRVDEYVSGAWTERAIVKDNGGYMSFQSRRLEDGQQHQFRVMPIAANGNEGTVKEFVILMVRHPDVPDAGYEYSESTKQLTISEN